MALPFYPALLSALVLVGLRESMSTPYLTLFVVERGRFDPIAVGVFMTVRAGGAIAMSTLFGVWFDRRPSLLPMCLSLVAGALGNALLLSTTRFGPLLLVAGLPLGMGSASFPLAFALARVDVAGADRIAAERRIAMLRAAFSASWAIGPAIGAVAVSGYDYDGLFWLSAVFSLLALVPIGLSGTRRWDRNPRPADAADRGGRSLAVVMGACSLTLFSLAVAAGAIVLPITVTVDLAGDKTVVGLAAGLCALLEVPVMMAIVVRPTLFPPRRGMAAGFVALAAYFLGIALASSVPAVLAWQAARAVGIGLVSCLGIGYLQDLMPNRAGAAAALYGNTGQIGNLVAGMATGVWAQSFGYHSLFWACAASSVLGLLVLHVGQRQ